MSGLTVVLADDEPLARERLRALLAAAPDVTLLAEAATGEEAVQAVRRHAPDVLLLDVEMPAGDGFEVLRALADGPLPVVVFVTAYPQFALKAFEAHALDYLLKPYDRERFAAALARAREQVALQRASGAAPRLVEPLLEAAALAQAPLRRLPLRDGGRIRFVDCADIDFIEAEGNYARVHTRGGQHVVRDTLTALEARLDPARFLRVHRSLVVNLERVKEVEPLPQGECVLVLHGGGALRSGRSFRARLFRALGLGA